MYQVPNASARRPRHLLKVTLITTLITALFAMLLAACQTGAPGGGGVDQTGTLQVNVTGVATAAVSVTGPGSYSRQLTSSTTLTGLEPGTYVVSATQVDTSTGSFAPVVSGSPATVAAGATATATATVTVGYVFLDPTAVGGLQIDVTGLGTDVNAAITVTGPGGFSQAVTASTTLTSLVPGYYEVSAANVTAGAATYRAVVDPATALVLPEETATVSIAYGQEAEQDDDSAIAHAVYAQFRPTSGPPVSVDAPLFNEAALDVKGLSYRNDVSYPGDVSDHLIFDISGGESQAVTITVNLDCGAYAADPSPIRARFYSAGGDLLRTITCNDGPRQLSIENSGTLEGFTVEIAPTLSDRQFYVAYELTMDAFCFGGCVYEPYVP